VVYRALFNTLPVSAHQNISCYNKDAEAPIFEAADYGIVGDVMQVLPKLLKSKRSEKIIFLLHIKKGCLKKRQPFYKKL
jgi:hypothetical protein